MDRPPIEPGLRTPLGTQDALLTANQMANALRSIQGTIHEINNDLGPLVGYLSIMEIGAQAEPKFVEAMQESVQRLQAHLARISSELRELAHDEPGPHCFATLVQQILSNHQQGGFFRRIGNELIVDPSFELHGTPWVMVCPHRFRQAFTNLLSNAVDAMEARKPDPHSPNRLHVVLRALPSQVQMEVQDFGVGLATEQLKLAFEPFHRAGPTKGTALGIGLGVVRRLVEQMNGEVELDSVPNQGTRVRLTLPRIPAPSAD